MYYLRLEIFPWRRLLGIHELFAQGSAADECISCAVQLCVRNSRRGRPCGSGLGTSVWWTPKCCGLHVPHPGRWSIRWRRLYFFFFFFFFFFWLLKGRGFCWPVIDKFQMGFYYLLIQFFMFVWVFTWTETSSVGLTEWVDVINVSDNFYIVFVTIVDSIAL